MRYVILGAGGVFGNNCAKYLLAQPDTEFVMGIGRNPRPPEHFSLNVGVDDPRYTYRQIHICHQFMELMMQINGIQPHVVINFAALAISTDPEHWSEYSYTNGHSVVRICEALHATKYPCRFIQISTSELYGSVTEAATESFPLLPTSPYSSAKASADLFLESVYRHPLIKFNMNIIRPSNCYAPGQLLTRIIPRTIVQGLSGKKVPLHGGGNARKSYMHANDLSRAIYLVATKAEPGKVYNAGPTGPNTILRIVELCAQAMGMHADDLIEWSPPRPGEDSMYWIDSSAIQKDLAWRAETGLYDGIKDMVAWGRKYLDQLKDESQEVKFAA